MKSIVIKRSGGYVKIFSIQPTLLSGIKIDTKKDIIKYYFICKNHQLVLGNEFVSGQIILLLICLISNRLSTPSVMRCM